MRLEQKFIDLLPALCCFHAMVFVTFAPTCQVISAKTSRIRASFNIFWLFTTTFTTTLTDVSSLSLPASTFPLNFICSLLLFGQRTLHFCHRITSSQSSFHLFIHRPLSNIFACGHLRQTNFRTKATKEVLHSYL